jgi:hypothetical protein
VKGARRLSREERIFLVQQGFDPRYFLRLSRTAEGYEFLETTSGKILSIRR